MTRLTVLILTLIVILAFSLRIYNVTEDPPALNWDEVSIGYNAYSILKTGKDEWGESFPLHFKSYGEYKLPAQIYASIPGIYFFGLNEFGVRITPVVYGTLSILILFLLTRVMFGNEKIALISAFLLAISPWHIHLTRVSFESSFAVFWVLLGIWFLVKSFSNSWWLYISVVSFAVSVYTYNAARVFTPLFLFVLAFIYRRKFFEIKKQFITAALFFVVLLLPLVSFVMSGQGSARYKLVSITNDAGLVPRINEQRGLSTLPGPLPKLVHNKYTYVASYFALNYFAHFTPDFLFISGAPHKQHHVQGIGELYLFQAPFFLMGLFLLFKIRYEFRALMLAWVLLTFIPVSATNDSIPHALRTAIAVPFYQIITALGGYYVFEKLWWKKKIFYGLGVLLIFWISLSLFSYLNNYYNIYPKLYSRDWQYGNKQVVAYIRDHYSEYDQIVYTRHFGEPHMFTLFYLNYDPLKFQNDPTLLRFETYDWIRVLKFDRFYFPDLGDDGTRFKDIAMKNKGLKTLFIGKAGDFPEDSKRLLTVKFLNGIDAFEIVESR